MRKIMEPPLCWNLTADADQSGTPVARLRAGVLRTTARQSGTMMQATVSPLLGVCAPPSASSRRHAPGCAPDPPRSRRGLRPQPGSAGPTSVAKPAATLPGWSQKWATLKGRLPPSERRKARKRYSREPKPVNENASLPFLGGIRRSVLIGERGRRYHLLVFYRSQRHVYCLALRGDALYRRRS